MTPREKAVVPFPQRLAGLRGPAGNSGEVPVFEQDKGQENSRPPVGHGVAQGCEEVDRWNGLSGRNCGGHVVVIEIRQNDGDQLCHKAHDFKIA